MPSIRLQRLPDRTPVKISLTLSPDLVRALGDYADFYARCYGAPEPLTVLIPAMLDSFLATDRAFARSRRAEDSRE